MRRPHNVVIFGATSAIAVGFARALAPSGARYHLVARNATKLAAVREDLLARGACEVWTSIADLDLVEAHGRLVSEAASNMGTIDAALLAQGSLSDQGRCEADPCAARTAWMTNFVAPASLASEVANYLERQGHGTLAAIGSVAGDRGRGSNYVYGCAKGALAIFLSGLRGRLRSKGIGVLTVKPGFVDTPMTAHFEKGPLWAQPGDVGLGILRAIERGRAEVYLPGFWRPIMWVIRHLPEPIFVRMKL